MAETAAVETPGNVPAKPVEIDPKAVPLNGSKPVEEATEEIKVNGKVIKLTKAQLVAAAQKGMFADQKLKSMDVLQNKTAALINALKTDPMSVLNDPALGISREALLDKIMAADVSDATKEKMSKWVYDNVVVTSKMTPEQLEKEKKLSDYERLKKAEEDRKTKEVTEAQNAQITQIYQAIRGEVTKQVLADKTFPQTEGSIRAVVEKLRVMNKQGAPITTENIGKALGLVKKDHILHQQALMDTIEDPEGLIALVGEERALKISRALVARIQAKAKLKVAEAKPEGEAPREKTTDRIDKKLGRTPQGYTVLDY